MKLGRVFVLALLFTVPVFAFAQNDGSMPPADEKPADGSTPISAPVDEGLADPEPVPESGVVPETATPATSSPAAADPRSASTSTPMNPAPAPSNASAASNPQQSTATINLGSATIDTVLMQEESSSPWLLPFLFVLALIPFGFFAASYFKKKPVETPDTEESDNRCFDIKEMMEAKLRELTDVRAIVEGKAKGIAKDALRDAVSGTATGDLLVRAEKLESQYAKLKALYEECRIDAERYAYKGVVIENSLLDKKVLEKVRVIGTRTEGEWTLHDIRLSKKQIEDIQKSIVDEKWYFHLWEPGKDQVTVVFKDKMFTITHSDTETWNEAIAYGEARGIARAQLDFRIVP